MTTITRSDFYMKKLIIGIGIFLGLSQSVIAAELVPSIVLQDLVKEEERIMTTTATLAKNVKLSVDEQYKQLSDPVLIDNERLFLPVRALSELLDIDIEYLPKHKLVIAQKDETYLELPLGYNQAVKNKTERLMIDRNNSSTRIFTYEERAYLPVRFIAENLGIEIMYKNNIVEILTTEIERNLHVSKIQAKEKVYNTGGQYLDGWPDRISPLQTIINSDGTISILNTEINNSVVSIYEYDQNASYVKAINVKAELSKVGAFTKDDEGNYYIIFGTDVPEGAFNDASIKLIKYDAAGNKINTFDLQAQTYDEKWAKGYSGVYKPFQAGSCRLEISGDKISAYFARLMFKASDGLNHQASYGFILNKDDFKRLSGKGEDIQMMPSAGHSFNQFILPIDEGFVFVDQGDVTPRAFAFEKVTNGTNAKINSFEFKQADTYQNTFSDLGGLAKTPNGYIFVGTYENTTTIGTNSVNGSRNLFTLTLDENLSKVSDPVYITSYIDEHTETAVHPKLVQIYDNKYLLLWEKYNTKTKTQTSYMGVIDRNGKLLGDVTELPNTILNANDVMRYNPKTGFVHWAVSQGSDTIVLYSLDINK